MAQTLGDLLSLYYSTPERVGGLAVVFKQVEMAVPFTEPDRTCWASLRGSHGQQN